MSEKCGVHLIHTRSLWEYTAVFPLSIAWPNIYTPFPTLPESVPSHPSPIVVTRPRTLHCSSLATYSSFSHSALTHPRSLTYSHTLITFLSLAKEAQVVAGRYLGFLYPVCALSLSQSFFFAVLLFLFIRLLFGLYPLGAATGTLPFNPPSIGTAHQHCDERNTRVGKLAALAPAHSRRTAFFGTGCYDEAALDTCSRSSMFRALRHCHQVRRLKQGEERQ
ncbi:hypothetical protein CCUS01_00774 [Colletotrichum cuscutae]|uniref:Uncharacterized protein n=1 Tax=Colletotrichum cuscutae TaxID=1209917 RepID=A0AAI9V4J9_9PEZI|nr:hypothetical protein CCUS01_00774 [Colletotrichum cuscutae]